MTFISNANARKIAWCQAQQDSSGEDGMKDLDVCLMIEDKGTDLNKAPSGIVERHCNYENWDDCEKAIRKFKKNR